jgi:HEPN superfamily AbiV-like protein
MVSDEALWAVTQNAARHLAEANQHHGGGRFASAVASAVYAIEETGKLAWLVTHGESPKRNKHAAHSMLFVALAGAISNWNWTMDWARLVNNQVAPDAPLTEQQRRTVAEHPEFAEFVRRLRAGELSTTEERSQAFSSAFLAKQARDGSGEPFTTLLQKGLQQSRLRAVYVDVTETGVSTPEATDPDGASALCWLALGWLMLIVAFAAHSRPSLRERYRPEIEGLLPGDLIGAADITRLLQAWQSARAVPGPDTLPPTLESNAA